MTTKDMFGEKLYLVFMGKEDAKFLQQWMWTALGKLGNTLGHGALRRVAFGCMVVLIVRRRPLLRSRRLVLMGFVSDIWGWC